jgi:hypothetical protein
VVRCPAAGREPGPAPPGMLSRCSRASEGNDLARVRLDLGAVRDPGAALRGRKVPPKYRSPTGETWAGRGARPKWMVEALKKGKKIEDFLIKRRRV